MCRVWDAWLKATVRSSRVRCMLGRVGALCTLLIALLCLPIESQDHLVRGGYREVIGSNHLLKAQPTSILNVRRDGGSPPPWGHVLVLSHPAGLQLCPAASGPPAVQL